MTKDEIKKEAEKFIDNVAPYWFRVESECREDSIEQFTKFAETILIKEKRLSRKCYCGNLVDTTNPDCDHFNLCKDHAADS